MSSDSYNDWNYLRITQNIAFSRGRKLVLDNMAFKKTRFLILSDTYGKDVSVTRNIRNIDVVIHCGNLTKGSRLDEFAKTIQMLEAINAPVKLVIPGSLDLTLEPSAHAELCRVLPIYTMLFNRIYGRFGQARKLFQDAGIQILSEGTHGIRLPNSAFLRLYASAYTPHRASEREVAYRCNPGGFRFDIPSEVDVAITHGPPAGILDTPESEPKEPLGCAELFSSIARARPKLHCFGRVHERWGSQIVTWTPTRAKAVNEVVSFVVRRLADLAITTADLKASDQKRVEYRKMCERRGFVYANAPASPAAAAESARASARGRDEKKFDGEGEVALPGPNQTLFVNASIEGGGDLPRHLPFVAEIELPTARESSSSWTWDVLTWLGLDTDRLRIRMEGVRAAFAAESEASRKRI
ncbi:Metallo-dependent phosphatase-like protein [Rostrohypoxylon terebratum]|nr:Metallo-dependent phosphatase-like protein [Rostrohypoxylon terebratum]